MRNFLILAGLVFTSTSWATNVRVHTLVNCGGYKIQYTGTAPRFVAGDPLKNTDSNREDWANVDGKYINAGNVYFTDLNGVHYPVQMQRQMAFQYHRYIIEQDILSIPTFDPLGDLGTPGEVTILHSPEGLWVGLSGLGDDTPNCELVGSAP